MTSPDAAGPADRLKSLLPPDLADRVRSLRLTDGRAVVVLDGTGLSVQQQTAVEPAVRAALEGAEGVAEVHVAVMADKPRQHILAVGSGKGGVGKSTLSANLAVALARLGRKVGLVDADISGPSQARLLGTEDQRPVAHESRLVPVASPWGVPMLSMAHLSEPGQAIAWRGSMVAGALTQFLEAHWDNAEIIVVDLPPGTGDVQLTMLQKFKPAGAVIVSTPQDLALMDAARAVSLFEKSNVPVVGVIENMAGYACPHCGEVSDPFGAGGAEAAAKTMGLDFLGRIPLDIAIRRDSDAGTPPAAGTGPQAEAFVALARRVSDWLDTI
ncbi:Mrp/NBP35 family ATP-binding protein [Novosphingobium sp. BL-8A]|uniref:Mrp/NBP35 family ATP-binding protein n=1 Tax=Novosphingobium sp. BL-8A TaxID=3127639 RepID=UPI003757EB5D